MFPYNKAINRSIRPSKRPGNMEDENKNDVTSSSSSEGEILWDFEEYKLGYVLDNFKMPQIVQVVEGFMFTEEDSLATGTVLTIHGQQKIEQICAVEEQGSCNDVYIPLSCPYRVKVTVPNREKIYRTVKDLCNATPLPKCVIVHEKITFRGIKIPPGRWLIVNSISKDKNDHAEGICVELLDDRIRTIVLPLKVIGNFAPCPLPGDQGRNYFVRELCDRSFPIWIKFLPSGEKNPPYGPHMGVLKLIKQQTMDVVFSTTETDGHKFAISFSRSLPVIVSVARGSLDNTETYSRRCKTAEEEVDIDVLGHLKDSNPYSCMYQSAIYADVCAIRKAFQERSEVCMNLSQCSSDSFHSDTTSFSEDKHSEGRFKMNTAVQSNGSIPHSYYDNRSSKSSSENADVQNQSKGNTTASGYSEPSYIYLDPVANASRNTLLAENDVRHDAGEDDGNDDDEDDDDDENDYEEIQDTMDSNISKPVRQSRKCHPYTYIDVKPPPRLSTSENEGNSGNRSPLPERLEDQPVVPLLKSCSLVSPEPSASDLIAFTSKRNLSRSMSERTAEMLSTADTFEHTYSEPLANLKKISNECDTESHVLDNYLFSSELMSDIDGFQGESKSKKVAPKKPNRPKGPPKPLPRKSSLQNFYSVHRDNFFTTGNTAVDGKQDIEKDTEFCAEETRERSVDAAGLMATNTDVDLIDFAEGEEQEIDKSSEQDLLREFSGGTEEVVMKEAINAKNDTVESRTVNYSYVNDLDESEVGEILDKIQLSEFKEVFKREQINGALLSCLDIDTLISLGMNRFQAIKVVDYVQRWCQYEDEPSDDPNDCNHWTSRDVFDRMNEINLKSLAEFCMQHQVDGKLLESIIDNDGFDCLKMEYLVTLNTLHQRKVEKYVKHGWRPDASLKR